MAHPRAERDPGDGSRDWREWAGAVLWLSLLLAGAVLSLVLTYWLVLR